MLKTIGRLLKAYPRFAAASAVVGGALLLILMSLLWKTEREQIAGAISDTVRSMEEGDADEAIRHVAHDYYNDGLDREALKELARKAIEYYGAPGITVLNKQIEVSDGLATARVNLLAHGTKRQRGLRNLSRSEWILSFQKEGKRWHIRKVTPVTFGGQPVESLRSLCRHFAPRIGPQSSSPARR